MAIVDYAPKFQHQDWIDNVDRVQAGSPNGFNSRFHAIEAEFKTLSEVVVKVDGGLDALSTFRAVGATPPPPAPTAVARDGAVAIGKFTTAAPPTYRLEVELGNNTGTQDRVRFGNAVCANGTAAFGDFAVFSHRDHANNSDYAVRQSSAGAVNINAAVGEVVSIRQGGSSVRLGISGVGNVIVGDESELLNTATGTPSVAIFQVAGAAFKNNGNASWDNTSDARVKEDVRDLEAGLAQLCQLRPVRFRYNGRGGTPAGLEGVGVLGQEIEKVFPETVRRVATSFPDDPTLEDLRIFNPSALTFVLINAVKELAGKVECLEQALASATAAAKSREP